MAGTAFLLSVFREPLHLFGERLVEGCEIQLQSGWAKLLASSSAITTDLAIQPTPDR